MPIRKAAAMPCQSMRSLVVSYFTLRLTAAARRSHSNVGCGRERSLGPAASRQGSLCVCKKAAAGSDFGL